MLDCIVIYSDPLQLHVGRRDVTPRADVTLSIQFETLFVAYPPAEFVMRQPAPIACPSLKWKSPSSPLFILSDAA